MGLETATFFEDYGAIFYFLLLHIYSEHEDHHPENYHVPDTRVVGAGYIQGASHSLISVQAAELPSRETRPRLHKVRLSMTQGLVIRLGID